MRSPLEVLPQDITDFLNANPYFADLPVIFYREGRTEEEIHTVLGGGALVGKATKVGAAVVVNMPVFEGEFEVPGPQLNPSITIECLEQPNINQTHSLGTRKSAEQIAQQVAECLQHHFSRFYYSALHPVRGGFITPSRAWKNYIAYEVRFQCVVQLDQRVRCAMPEIDPDSPAPATNEILDAPQLITLSCATPGAQIFYTIDESLPTPSSTAYTEPFWMQGGILRAAAYRQDLLGSFVNDAVYRTVILGDEQGLPIGDGGSGEIVSTP